MGHLLNKGIQKHIAIYLPFPSDKIIKGGGYRANLAGLTADQQSSLDTAEI